MTQTKKLVIIGAGPAGLTAALYAARNGLDPLVFEGVSPGGQLMTSTEVENYPGFPESVLGPQLIQAMRQQAERFGAALVQKDVEDLEVSGRPFGIAAAGEAIKAETVIVATGASANLLGLESESRLMGRGVSVCATCDGSFFREKDILVIGGGDSAMEEAIFLTRFAKSVAVVHRRDELRASKIMQQRVMSHPKIDILWSRVPVEVLGDEAVTGARLRNVKTDEVTEVACQGVFLAIGHTPNAKLVEGKLELDARGYIVTRGGRMWTSVEGVFAAGDVVDHVYRQAVTAAGMGCMAALDAQKFLASVE